MSYELTAKIIDGSTATGYARWVLVALAHSHNRETGQCNPSVSKIARLAGGIGVRTAKRYLAILEAEGRITRTATPRTTSYTITDGCLSGTGATEAPVPLVQGTGAGAAPLPVPERHLTGAGAAPRTRKEPGSEQGSEPASRAPARVAEAMPDFTPDEREAKDIIEHLREARCGWAIASGCVDQVLRAVRDTRSLGTGLSLSEGLIRLQRASNEAVALAQKAWAGIMKSVAHLGPRPNGYWWLTELDAWTSPQAEVVHVAPHILAQQAREHPYDPKLDLRVLNHREITAF